MGYFYAIMWFAVGLILIFSLSKENKVFYGAGAFFLLLGAWWLADSFLPEQDLFAGGWGIALRCVAAAALIILTVFFVREYRKNRDAAREREKKTEEKNESSHRP